MQDELVAVCNRSWRRLRLPLRRWRAAAHEVAQPSCSCGIYATNDLELAADYLYLYDEVRQPHLRCRAFGRVALWGSVVEGDDGWRASRAYPERILLPRTDAAGRGTEVDAIAAELAVYGVPIDIVEDDADAAVGRAIRRVKCGQRLKRRGATQTG